MVIRHKYLFAIKKNNNFPISQHQADFITMKFVPVCYDEAKRSQPDNNNWRGKFDYRFGNHFFFYYNAHIEFFTIFLAFLILDFLLFFYPWEILICHQIFNNNKKKRSCSFGLHFYFCATANVKYASSSFDNIHVCFCQFMYVSRIQSLVEWCWLWKDCVYILFDQTIWIVWINMRKKILRIIFVVFWVLIVTVWSNCCCCSFHISD